MRAGILDSKQRDGAKFLMDCCDAAGVDNKKGRKRREERLNVMDKRRADGRV